MTYLRRCHECNQPLGKKELFCPRCGAKQPREPRRQSMDRVQLVKEK
jgi:rRNA maturation endonuclease Nob1